MGLVISIEREELIALEVKKKARLPVKRPTVATLIILMASSLLTFGVFASEFISGISTIFHSRYIR